MIRRVTGLVQGRHTMDGAGVKLYRVFGGTEIAQITDPFLLLDFFGSSNPEDYIMGFPWHPHRGIETVTYVMEGKVEHEDSEGNKGVIYPGDVQWMTAGSGIFHQEMPKPLDEKEILHTRVLNTNNKGLQLWINLPANRKMTTPVYRGLKNNQIPREDIEGGYVKIIAGEYNGIPGPVKAGKDVDPTYLHVVLSPESQFYHKVKEGYTVLAYVIKGKAKFDQDTPEISEGNLVIFGDGNEIKVNTNKDSSVEFILLSGKPLKEPIAWYGPIVMNTQQQILEALSDLRKGTFVRNKTPIFE
ncbi:pirin family protein [Acidianus sulfidivorans JP7]|uniref:Pirin family protein n=1 Tax=Acidianus sulfidivorans JP7 TaxID=619593 RepID=A0A2U9IQD3_9CREN|nr:pirin family protein [Acidianus sulfidivorans]AWR98241.1 pirin family protein [Acidianus sulfidivorans JP7]